MLAPSIEDDAFLQTMEKGFHKDETNSWVAPLIFKTKDAAYLTTEHRHVIASPLSDETSIGNQK